MTVSCGSRGSMFREQYPVLETGVARDPPGSDSEESGTRREKRALFLGGAEKKKKAGVWDWRPVAVQGSEGAELNSLKLLT